MEKEKVKIEAVPWSEAAAAFLAPTCISGCVEDYKSQVEEGAALFCVSRLDTGQVLGYYILRVDQWAEKTIGVLVVAAGLPGYDFAGHVMPIIEGQFLGVDEIHQYCSRAGMVKKLLAQDWQATHLVMRKVVNRG